MNFTPGSKFSNTKPSGILWDMDGVLVDTADEHFQSWMDALTPHGIAFDRVTFNKYFGMNNQSFIQNIFSKEFSREDIQKISDQKEIDFRKIIHRKLKLMPGVQEWLKSFSEGEIPQALASSAPKENIDAILDETGIRKYFRVIVSAFGKPGKPDPWVFLEAGKRLGVNAKTTIVIEDSPAGVLGAHRAGYHCIAVSSLLTPEESKTADLVVDRLDHVNIKDIERIISD